MIKVESDDWGEVKVAGDLTVHNAMELRDALVAILDPERTEWTLDLGGVTDLDTAGVQVLLAFRKSAGTVKVHSCPERQRVLLERVGLADHLLV
jgi:anti-anti-sigma factor